MFVISNIKIWNHFLDSKTIFQKMIEMVKPLEALVRPYLDDFECDFQSNTELDFYDDKMHSHHHPMKTRRP